jgi:hypothetical protein
MAAMQYLFYGLLCRSLSQHSPITPHSPIKQVLELP